MKASELRAKSVEELNGELIRIAIRLVAGVCLLSDDPDYVRAEVLVKDLLKYERTGDQGLVAKAKRRGIVGWSIGEHFETIPHFRRPHFGIRWTKKGRSVPKLVPIKGAIVHRSKLSDVPTGLLEDDGMEVEPALPVARPLDH